MPELTLVGGKADGERKMVGDPLPERVTAQISAFGEGTSPATECEPLAIPEEVYVLERIHTSGCEGLPPATHYYYRHQDLSLSTSITRLLKGYGRL